MPRIHLTTFIAAPAEKVFDLSRHLAILKHVFNSRKEQFSSGAGSNLLLKGETITVSAKHAGKIRMATIKISEMQRPVSFTEEQVKGDLKHLRHEHHFKAVANGTIVIDLVDYAAPHDFLGKILARFYLKRYLEELVHKRNETVRSYAETEKWRAVLS